MFSKRATREVLMAVVVSFVAGSGAPALAGVTPDESDPRKIMEAVEARQKGDRAKAHIVITIIDGNGRKRQRELSSRSLQFEGGTRQLMVFESPADVKGTGFLSVDYDSGKKDDDQWLYLPSQHKTSRISSGEKSGSFMGTDYSYADMTTTDPDDYDFKLLEQTVEVDGETCWLIEGRPRTEKAKTETGYLKTHNWISKEKLMPIRTKAWVKAGRKLKYMAQSEIKKVNGVWAAHKLVARTRQGKKTESTTVMQFTRLSYDNDDVTPQTVSQRQLEKGL